MLSTFNVKLALAIIVFAVFAYAVYRQMRKPFKK